MKKLTTLLCLVLLLLNTNVLRAQVVEVCVGDGTDSVTLYVGNYQYGNIQWQSSDDMLTWSDIPGANDTVYCFLPQTGNVRYYRAWMQYPNCPPDSSQITRILFTPTANAGPDRVLNAGYVAHLFGNTVDDARCMWQVVEGDSANLAEPNYPQSAFYGSDTLYRLTWTVANACGVSVDTVEIRYVVSHYYDAVAFVDTTDIILSDSAELVAGIYRIIFSNPAPSITDSTVLVGLVEEGFLRRVVAFKMMGDTCEMYTGQATIGDLLMSGVINYDGPLFHGLENQTRGNQWHRYTRAELLQDPRYQAGQLLFYPQSRGGQYRPSENSSVISLGIPQLSLQGGWSMDNVSASMNPHLIWDYKKGNDGELDILAGFNAQIMMDFTVHAVSGSINISNSIPFAAVSIPIGAVVITPVASLAYDISATLQSQSAVDIPVHFSIPVRCVVHYVDGAVTYLENAAQAAGTVMSNLQSVTYELGVAVGPKVSVKLYGVAGPFMETMGKVSYTVCNGENGFVSRSHKLSVLGDFGVEMKIFKLLNLSLMKRFEKDLFEYRNPHSIMRLTNTNLFCVNGTFITEPVRVKVSDMGNNPSGLAKVLYQPLNGGFVAESLTGTLFSSREVLTDGNGLASLFWKPGDSGSQVLKVNLYDCHNHHLVGSPVLFQANASQSCANSTLTLKIAINSNGQMVPKASDGAGGYSYFYSTNGVNYQPYTPIIPIMGVDYEFYVEDANGCIAGTSYILNNPCENSGLSLEYEITEYNEVGVRAINGTAPYAYMFCNEIDTMSMQGPSQMFVYFTPHSPSNHTILFLEGDYQLSVVDALGCRTQTTVTVHTGDYEPSVALYNISDITLNSAKVSGLLLDAGRPATEECGVCWTTSGEPTYYSNRLSVPIPAGGAGQFEVVIPNLNDEMTYVVRAYAKNAGYIVYSDTASFKTLTLPWAHVEAVTQVSVPTAQAVCQIYSDGGAPVTERGVCWSTSPNPELDNAVLATEENMVSVLNNGGVLYTVNGDGIGTYTCGVGGLSGNTTYYVRAFATSHAGTGYSGQQIFTTPTSIPTVTTAQPTDVTFSAATCGGNIITDGGAAVISRGVCWSTSQNPTLNDNYTAGNSATSSYTCTLTDLTPNTTYYVRAYATNSVGTAYGNRVVLNVLDVPSIDSTVSCLVSSILSNELGANGVLTAVRDCENNSYSVVQIGNQCWMKVNLRSTKYMDSTDVQAGTTTSSSSIPYYYVPNNDIGNVASYGYLYNWPAVKGPESVSAHNQGICPMGWHVPSGAEWSQLTQYVSGQSRFLCDNNNTYIAKSLASSTGWHSSVSNYTCAVSTIPEDNNATGFSALPAGCCYDAGHYDYFSYYTYFWSTTESGVCCMNIRKLGYLYADMRSDSNYKSNGYSVRCIRDGNGPNGTSSVVLPMVSTLSAGNITDSSATCGGHVTSDGGAPVTSRGVCWSTSHNPMLNDNYVTNGSDTGSFISSITGLNANTTYYFRAFAINRAGTVYGEEGSFTTLENGMSIMPCPGMPTVTDIDNNTYNTVLIGNQCWMRENMRCITSPNTGASILQNPASGHATTERRAYYYNDDPSTCANGYGLLYNWPAAVDGWPGSSNMDLMEGVRGICPVGWHIPTEAEWETLKNFVMSQSLYVCGSFNSNIAKSLAAKSGWYPTNGNCYPGNNLSQNNATGFSALPAGMRNTVEFHSRSEQATFWSSSGYTPYCFRIDNYAAGIFLPRFETDMGFSVRCLRD